MEVGGVVSTMDRRAWWGRGAGKRVRNKPDSLVVVLTGDVVYGAGRGVRGRPRR